MSDYVDVQPASQPPWLQRPNGRAWGTALGAVKDAFLEATKRAVLARFPAAGTDAVAPVDALAKQASNFRIDPSLVDPTPALLARMIAAAWDAWEAAGTKAGLLARLAEMGLPNAQVFEAFDWAPFSPAWWRFWVVLSPTQVAPGILAYPFPSTAYSDGVWSDATATWHEPFGGWAEAMPAAWLAQLRAVIKKWKPFHAECAAILLLRSGETFGSRIATKPTWGSGQVWSSAQVIYLEA